MKMRDDELIAALGEAGRELDVAADRRWDGLATGELSAEDMAALEAIARESDAGREAFEAFRPIDEAGRAKMTDEVLAAMGAAPAAEGAASTASVVSTERVVSTVSVTSTERATDGAAEKAASVEAGGARAKGDNVVPLARRRGLLPALLAAASLAAAAALVVGLRPGAPLPGYELTASGGSEVRALPGQAPSATGDAVVRLGPGAILKLRLRPERKVEGPIAVRGFLAREGRLSAWSAPSTIEPSGYVEIAGAREALFPALPPGVYPLVILVGREEALPKTPDEVSRVAADEGGSGAVRVLRVKVELHDGTAR